MSWRDEDFHGHYLLPLERSVVAWILKIQRAHPTAPIMRLERNYGPEGMVLYNAGLFWVEPGGLFVLMTLLVMASPLYLHRELIGVWQILLVPCFGFLISSIIRGIQAERAGKRFRAGRPVEKRPGYPWSNPWS